MNVEKEKIGIVMTIALMFVFNSATFGYTPPDCDGCAEATPGYQYQTYDDHCLYIENYKCDLEGSIFVSSGDDDPDYGIDLDYVALNGCDGYKDTATLTYTKRYGTEYSINLGFEVPGLTVGGSVTSTYEEETGLTKPVECPACRKGKVFARSVRVFADVTVTVKSHRKYDKVVREKIFGGCAQPTSTTSIVRTTPFSKLCETSTYNETGYVYGMEFPQEFYHCPNDENGCPCEVKE